jgi:antibiotic biosynthesis monooxygenase (ABM) superfamily enzyme
MESMKPPRKWKMAILIWVAIYPTITILFLVLGTSLGNINPLPLRTLVITLVVVPLMVFFLIPGLQKIMGRWLRS